MLKLTMNYIDPSTDVEQTVIGFNTEYRDGNRWTLGGETVPYRFAIRIFKSFGLVECAKTLEDRVAELSPKADQLKALEKQLKPNFVELKKFEVEKLGPLANVAIKLEGKRYENWSCDQYLCELTAHEKGKEYSPPTSDEFLKTCAKSLAKFQEPYKREEFLIKPDDLRKLYLEHTGQVHRGLIPELMVKNKIFSTIETLWKYIAAEVSDQNVKLRMVNRKEMEGKAVLPDCCSCGSCQVFLELTIGNRVSYLLYNSGLNPFRFLEQQKSS